MCDCGFGVAELFCFDVIVLMVCLFDFGVSGRFGDFVCMFTVLLLCVLMLVFPCDCEVLALRFADFNGLWCFCGCCGVDVILCRLILVSFGGFLRIWCYFDRFLCV